MRGISPSKELALEPIRSNEGPIPKGEECADVGAPPKQVRRHTGGCDLFFMGGEVGAGHKDWAFEKEEITHVPLEEGQVRDSLI